MLTQRDNSNDIQKRDVVVMIAVKISPLVP